MPPNSDPGSVASSGETWSEPLSVPPASPRRTGIRGSEILVCLAIVGVLVALLNSTYHTSYYRCIFCRTLKSDHEWNGFHWSSDLKPGPATPTYDSLASPGHKHRWTRGRTDSDRSFLTGAVTAVFDRDGSPLLSIDGEDYIRLLRERHAREGSLTKLEAEFNEVQDAFDRKDQVATDRLFLPFREEVFGRFEKPTGRAESAGEPSAEVDPPPAPSRKPFPGGI